MGIIIVLSFLVENLISRGRRVAIYNSYEKPVIVGGMKQERGTIQIYNSYSVQLLSLEG